MTSTDPAAAPPSLPGTDPGTDPGPGPLPARSPLAAHVARALADLRLLIGFVAMQPDRQAPEIAAAADGAAGPPAGPPGDNAALYLRVAALAAEDADAIAVDPRKTAELFFLLDRLSQASAPATPDSIRLTSAYLDYPMEDDGDGREAAAAAGAARREAGTLHRSLRRNRRVMLGVFAVTLGMSIYSLFGQVLIRERDQIVAAIDREATAFYSQSRLAVSAASVQAAGQGRVVNADPGVIANYVVQVCPRMRIVLPAPLAASAGTVTAGTRREEEVRIYPTAEYMRSCDQFEYLAAQRTDADRAVSDWVAVTLSVPDWALGRIRRWIGPEPRDPSPRQRPPATQVAMAAGAGNHTLATSLAADDGAGEQADDEVEATPRQPRDYSYKPWGETTLTALGAYVLPILFGVIGAWAAGERELRRRMERFEVSRTDRHTIRRGLLLGGVVGGVVGLFFTAEDLKNLALTYSAIALLGGFAGDRVFRFLDDLINRVFGISRPQAAAVPAPAAK